MPTTTIAYVTDSNSKEYEHIVLSDGVTVLPNGTLLLTYDRDSEGKLVEGHIYAHGQWKEVNIQRQEV